MKRLVWLVVPALLAAGCRSNQVPPQAPAARAPQRGGAPVYQAPSQSRNTYAGPTSPPAAYDRPAPPPPPPSYARNPAYALPSSGSFQWVPSLQQARDLARSEGKLLFIETGRDACGNCQALKQKVIPQPSVASELGALAVGYYDDCDRDPNSAAFKVLQSNLPNAVMLPLVGWVTPDMRWVYGFSGRRDEARFRQDIATARATYLRMAEAERPAGGTREMAEAPVRATVVPTSLPDEELADVTAELGTEIPLAPSPSLTAAALPVPESPPAPETAPAVEAVPAPVPVLAAPEIVAAPSGAATGAHDELRVWARAELGRAAEALRNHDFAGARAILDGIRAKAEGSPEAREADKGDVAIHDLRRAEQAADADAARRIREQAARDLRGTVWAPLFS